MPCMREISLAALVAGLILSLWAAPRPAEAGVCKDLGLGKQCVVRRDIKKNAVKSSGVADESLTGADIRDGSLTGADLQDGSVTGANLQDGSIGGSEFQGGSLTGADFQDGSLSGADLQDGSITAAELAADAVTPDNIFARTLVVSPVGDGSDATANGQELLDAITFLGGVSPAPAVANPWTLKLEPGVYDVGVNSVDLLPYVELVGTGQGATEITGSVEGNVSGNPAIVNMTGNTSLRNVSVSNFGNLTNSFSHAIKIEGGPITLANVTAQASDATNSIVGIRAITCGELTLTSVTTTAETSGGESVGADLRCSSVKAADLTARGVGQGLRSGTVTFVRNSILEGGTAGVDHFGGTLNIAHSQLIGPIVGSPTCIGTYGAGLAAVAC